MTLLRQIMRDMATALAVLAIVFLTFSGHATETGDGSTTAKPAGITFVSFCGDADPSKGAAAGPCHACRSTPASLPTPPCVTIPVVFQPYAVADEAPLGPISTGAPRSFHTSRAPPTLI